MISKIVAIYQVFVCGLLLGWSGLQLVRQLGQFNFPLIVCFGALFYLGVIGIIKSIQEARANDDDND